MASLGGEPPGLLKFIEDLDHLGLDFDEPSSFLAQVAVGLGHVGEATQVRPFGGEVAQAITAAIGQDRAGMQLAARAAAGGLAALAVDLAHASAPEGRGCEGDAEQARVFVAQALELLAELCEGCHLCQYVGYITQFLRKESRKVRSGPNGDRERAGAQGTRKEADAASARRRRLKQALRASVWGPQPSPTEGPPARGERVSAQSEVSSLSSR